METDARDLPARVTRGRGRAPLVVEQVEEVWRIAEAWWREAPVGRTYYRVIVDGGRTLTLFHDDLGGMAVRRWFEQRY